MFSNHAFIVESMPTQIQLTRDGSVHRILFSAGGKPCTLDHEVLEQLDACLDTIETSDGRSVRIESDSEKYFVVGANINALATLDASTIAAWVHHGHTVFSRLEALPLPVVCVVRGFALGGGLELALACDMIFASNTATFGQPETSLGFVTGWGGSARLPRRVGPGRAREMIFSGRQVAAEEALKIGLIEFVGSEDALAARLADFESAVASQSATATAAMKKLLALHGDNGCEAEAEASQELFQTGDTAVRLEAFLASRRPSQKS